MTTPELLAVSTATNLDFIREVGITYGTLYLLIGGPVDRSVEDSGGQQSTIVCVYHIFTRAKEKNLDTKIVHYNEWQNRLHWIWIFTNNMFYY